VAFGASPPPDRSPGGQGADAAPSAASAPESGPPSLGGDQEGVQIHPDAVSSFLTRAYPTRPDRLWKGLMDTLRAVGYPPEEVDEAHRKVKTSFVDVKGDDFPEPIGDRPPEFGPTYTILQLPRVTEGKLSLEAIVAPEGKGAAISLRARLLVPGLDRKRRVRVLTDRRSSGVVEEEFLKKLELALKIKPI
jgi:hypothetical protein